MTFWVRKTGNFSLILHNSQTSAHAIAWAISLFGVWGLPVPSYHQLLVPRYLFVRQPEGTYGYYTPKKMKIFRIALVCILLYSCKHEYVVVLEKVTTEEGHGNQVIQDVISERSDNDAYRSAIRFMVEKLKEDSALIINKLTLYDKNREIVIIKYQDKLLSESELISDTYRARFINQQHYTPITKKDFPITYGITCDTMVIMNNIRESFESAQDRYWAMYKNWRVQTVYINKVGEGMKEFGTLISYACLNNDKQRLIFLADSLSTRVGSFKKEMEQIRADIITAHLSVLVYRYCCNFLEFPARIKNYAVSNEKLDPIKLMEVCFAKYRDDDNRMMGEVSKEWEYLRDKYKFTAVKKPR